jgi:hypothetical protein
MIDDQLVHEIDKGYYLGREEPINPLSQWVLVEVCHGMTLSCLIYYNSI